MRTKSYMTGYRGRILGMILENGFLPYDIFGLYDKNTTVQMQRIVRKMKEEEVIREQRTISNAKYLVLTKKGEELITKQAPPADLEAYNSPRQKMRLRHLQLSKPAKDVADHKEKEITYKLKQNKIINDVTAKIFAQMAGIDMGDNEDLNSGIDTDTPHYYDSASIKSSGSYKATFETSSGTQKLNNSRINGLTVSEGGIYSIYSTGNVMPEWRRNGEVKIAACIQSLMRKTIEGMSMQDYVREAVVISKKESNFVRMISNKGGGNDKSRRKTLMNIDFVYEHMYSIPYTYDGVKIFRLMQMPGWQRMIKTQILTQNEMEESNYVSVNCDGYDKRNGIYKLIYCIPDMTKLKEFGNRARIEQDKDKYHVFCYKSQLPIVAPVVKDNAKVFVIDIEDMYSELEIDA